MSAIDFPSSPANGQQYTFNGRTWQFNGYGWVQIPFGGQVVNAWIALENYVDVLESFDEDMFTDLTWYELSYV
jgi:hypothetical protein